MNLEPFKKILKKAMGLAPDSLGKSGVKHALQVRMRELGCDEAQYLNVLRNDEREVSELVEEVVVPETWFFRDTKPFELLSETALSCRKDSFKVLSAPCSTGEEPYSVAMALMGAGLPQKRIRVDAVDISVRALDKAKKGVYTDNSFRSELPPYAEGCFEKKEHGRILADRVRNIVNFYPGNIVEGCLPLGQYDAIFCRNLIIYLDDNSRECLVRLFSEKLKKGGLLFVGHAEALPIFNKYFSPVRRPGVFAFKKNGAGPVEGRACKPASVERVKDSPECGRSTCLVHSVSDKAPRRAKRTISPVTTVKPRVVKNIQVQVSEKQQFSLKDIKVLADRGETARALSLCEAKLLADGPQPDMLHLCGLLCEAQGNPVKAEEYYNKAIYLNPKHLDSLIHLSLLVETRGDKRKAAILRNRVQRAENQNEAG
ncbi:CheR family methyltransferase [Maridesulfovibrio frigidus]|uniref:CheR family methyltransferase n=1 Tax=Maridesulfovibrio frigidus TaxID=340956 RepID=UPI0004E26AAF|nr:CheR family methyltransferase [Maridesulfovibrio frigidus]